MKKVPILKLNDTFDSAVIGLKNGCLVYDHTKVISILIDQYRELGYSEEESISIAHDDFTYNYLAYFVDNCPVYE